MAGAPAPGHEHGHSQIVESGTVTQRQACLQTVGTLQQEKRPFTTPKNAVKVINHYGDEVLKVYRTEEVRGV